jgi:hypothetical protein
LRGNSRYCISKVRLGREYIPDFLIADVDSAGIHWTLIELETPTSSVFLKNGKTLDAKARRGVEQITEWRQWLTNNLSYARRPRHEDGLGLFDITPSAPAYVFVGRRHRLGNGSGAARAEHKSQNGIQIHTYDALVEWLRGSMRHTGLPTTNPYALPRD